MSAVLHGGDAIDFDQADASRAARRRAKSTKASGASSRLKPPKAPSGREPIDVVRGKIHKAVDEALETLGRVDCGVYQRGGMLVRPVVIGRAGRTLTLREERPGNVTRPEGSVILEPLSQAALTEVLSRHIEFMRYDGRSKQPANIDPPPEVARTILDRRGLGWTLPSIRAVVSAPALRPDASVMHSPGFDDETGLLFVSERLWPEMIETPSRNDAARAAEALLLPIRQMPFVDGSDRAAALALLITAVVRPSLDRAPMFAVSAPTAGTGKSLLVDVAAIMATGRPACVVTPTPDEIELEKRIGASALAGDSVLNIDNVTHPLRSDQLCQLLSQDEINVRVLGRSENVRIASTALVCATGNNLALHGDLNRRAIRIRLDAGIEKPDERRFADDPRLIAIRGRIELVRAALTVVRAYFLAGRPNTAPPMGSFETWSGIVRSALMWAGYADCRANADEFRAEDPERQALAEIVDALPSGTWTVRDLRLRITENADLRAALAQFIDRTGMLSAPKMGGWLRRFKDRPVSGRCIRLVTADEKHGSTWTVAAE